MEVWQHLEEEPLGATRFPDGSRTLPVKKHHVKPWSLQPSSQLTDAEERVCQQRIEAGAAELSEVLRAPEDRNALRLPSDILKRQWAGRSTEGWGGLVQVTRWLFRTRATCWHVPIKTSLTCWIWFQNEEPEPDADGWSKQV